MYLVGVSSPTISQDWIIIGIFLLVFAGIFADITDKAILAAIGAVACLILGGVSQGAAGTFLDFETMSLLLGMMIIVGIAEESGLFELASIKILKITQGRPLAIFLLFMLNTLLLSSFLNNVTTVLIILPLSLEIARGIGLNPRPLILGEIFFANIGGLLTLIGDPVNTIVGSAGGLGMLDFIRNMWIPVSLHALAIIGYLYLTNRPQFRSIKDNFVKMFHNQLVIRTVEDRLEKKKLDRVFLWTAGLVLGCTIAAFLFAERIGYTAGAIALFGAAAAMLIHVRKVEPERMLKAVDWRTLLFFGGLFIIVGSVEQTGVLDQIARALELLTSNPYLLVGILLVGTGVVSAFIDNIPFVTVMIPIIRALQDGPLFPHNPEMLWWALSLGAVMGGMASPFGSSANIVAIGCVHRLGMRFTTASYLKSSVLISAAGMVIAYLYLLSAYEF